MLVQITSHSDIGLVVNDCTFHLDASLELACTRVKVSSRDIPMRIIYPETDTNIVWSKTWQRASGFILSGMRREKRLFSLGEASLTQLDPNERLCSLVSPFGCSATTVARVPSCDQSSARPFMCMCKTGLCTRRGPLGTGGRGSNVFQSELGSK